MWFVIAYHGPRFEREFKSVPEAKKWAERYTPLRRGWSMSWTYHRKSRWWVLTVVNSKGRRVNDVGLRRMRPGEPRRQAAADEVAIDPAGLTLLHEEVDGVVTFHADDPRV